MLSNQRNHFQQTHLYSLVPASNACTRKLGCLNSSSSRSYLDVRHVGIKKRFFFLWLGIGTARHRRRSHSTQCLCDAKHDEVDSLQLSRRKSRENKCHNRQESVVDLVEGVRLKGGIFQASRSETNRDVFVTVAHLSNKTFFVS